MFKVVTTIYSKEARDARALRPCASASEEAIEKLPPRQLDGIMIIIILLIIIIMYNNSMFDNTHSSLLSKSTPEVSGASEDRPRRGPEEKRADRLGNRCHVV